MTTIFVSFAKEDATCAEHILQGLEAKGYNVWRESGYPNPTDASYPHMIENAIVKSAAVVLVWSSHAAQSAWVRRHTTFSQQLKKQIVPVVLDGTSLPDTLVSLTPLTGPCSDALAHILPQLPSPTSVDPLMLIWEQAAHEFIRERRAAIEHAAELLQRGEHREAVLAVLEYLAHNDLMMGVREKAQEVLNADAGKNTPQPPPGQSRHIFGVRCKNGHVTYFDKRRVCVDEKLVRGSAQHAGVALDELDLTCGECGAEVTVRVDCGGYR